MRYILSKTSAETADCPRAASIVEGLQGREESDEALHDLILGGMLPFLEEPPGNRVEQKGVPARPYLHVDIGDRREGGGRGIDDDDLRALKLDRLPHPVAEDVVVREQVGAGDEDEVRLEELIVLVPVGDAHAAERVAHLARMVVTRGGEGGLPEAACDLPDEEDLFVRRPGRDDEAYALVLPQSSLARAARTLRLLRRKGPRARPLPRPAQGAPRGSRNRTRTCPGHRGSPCSACSDLSWITSVTRPPSNDVEVEGAAEAAVGTRGEMALNLPGPALQGAQVLREGADRADEETLAAGDAVARVRGRHSRIDPRLHEVEDASARYLPARVDAAQAEDAAVLPVPDEGRGVAIRSLVSLCTAEVGLLDPVLEDEVLQVAFAALRRRWDNRGDGRRG